MSNNTFRIAGIDLYDVFPSIMDICCGVLLVIAALLFIWVGINIEKWTTKKD